MTTRDVSANTHAEIYRHIWGYRRSQCVGVAAELQLPEKLAGGPRSAADLARECGVHERSLFRVMRTLAALGVLRLENDGRFSLTPVGEELRADRLGPLARMFTRDPHWTSWMRLDHSVRTGERAFDLVHGMRDWDYYATNPDAGAIFDQAMSALTKPVAKAVAATYDFSRFGVVADVGGGDGTLLMGILDRYASIRGLIYDLPGVIERTRKRVAEAGLSDRMDLVAGSFLEGVPAGADVYMMKSIIHDWEDADAHRILKHVRAAAGAKDTRLLLIERVLGEKAAGEDIDNLLSDLNMMVNLGGQERTEAEFEAMLSKTGFRLERIIPTGTVFYTLEAVTDRPT